MMIYKESDVRKFSKNGIAIAVAKKLGYRFLAKESGVYIQPKSTSKSVRTIHGIFKPTERWDDAAPIIENYSVEVSKGLVKVYLPDGDFWEHSAETTLRALCEAFLMMEI